MTIKEIFDKGEDGALNYDQFTALMKENGAQFEDVKDGRYVSKNKFDSEIKSRDEQISTLSNTISTRDTDLETLKSQLAEAGTDATKLTELQSQFDSLKGQYDADTKNYKAQLKKQAYEFAVREFAGTKKFTSTAAKRDFERSMIAKELKLEDGNILGAEDFVTAYSKDNADAFVVEKPQEETESAKPKPTFVQPTAGAQPPKEEGKGGFASAFNFIGVRPHPEQ